MASIRIYRKKIKSARNIAKITRAMQMVAASKMKRAQEMAQVSRGYADGILDLSNEISFYVDTSINPLLHEVKGNRGQLVIVIAPEKGLCGSLLTNTVRFINKIVMSDSSKNVKFIAIGKKARYVVGRIGGEIIAEFNIGMSQPTYDIVSPITRLITESFTSGEVGKVSVVYNEFINTMTQKPSFKTILPLTMIGETFSDQEDGAEVAGGSDMLFEPSAKDITDSLLERSLEIEIYQFLLEAYASEQSARMLAMKNATDNAEGLISDLTIKFNNARQASITTEIADISSANMISE